jgi:uncharacterized membrane protein
MFHAWNGGWAGSGAAFGFSWLGLLLGASLLIALVAAVAAAIRSGKGGSGAAASARDQGLLILTERFARGEIDAESFRAMKAELEGKA